MTQKTFARSAFASITIALTIFSAGNAVAANGQTPLGDCYNRVIAICNEGAHPGPCAESAMDACDDEFGSNTGTLGFGLRTVTKRVGVLGLTMKF